MSAQTSYSHLAPLSRLSYLLHLIFPTTALTWFYSAQQPLQYSYAWLFSLLLEKESATTNKSGMRRMKKKKKEVQQNCQYKRENKYQNIKNIYWNEVINGFIHTIFSADLENIVSSLCNFNKKIIKKTLKLTIDIKCGHILTEKERCCTFAEQLEINILG